MNRSLIVIIGIVALNAIGVGLISPILPSLLKDVSGVADITKFYGAILASYAAMQFLFSPILGTLSDRFGRRPVLILSLTGAAIDYLIMAFSPMLWVLFVGRMIAGVTGASMAVAGAYIADITEKKDRAQRFGWMTAAFGAGLVIGPVIGGALSGWFLRAPFLVAALLNAANLIAALWVLKETRIPSREPFRLASLNPLAPLRRAFGLAALAPLIGLYLVFAFNGGLIVTIWMLYGAEKFGWPPIMLGLFLSVFGISSTLSQALLVGPIIKRFGDRQTMIIGIVCGVLAFLGIAFATQGWMVYALATLLAFGGIRLPALQSMMSAQAGRDKQGELQGVLSSGMSLMMVVTPLIGTTIYLHTKAEFIGTVWLVGAALFLITFPILASIRRQAAAPA